MTRALTHRSYMNEHADAVEDNERLEFLGDAILDYVVTIWLYHQYPEMREGELTRMRSAFVHTEQLADFSRKMNLGDVLLLGKGESQAGGRKRDALLCDMFEALIGAYYLDSGIEAVRAFIIPLLEETSDDIIRNRKSEDPKSRFQEWVQAQGHSAPHYRVIREYGPDHSKVFEVEVLVNEKPYGKGTGNSKQSATKDAARNALKKIGLME